MFMGCEVGEGLSPVGLFLTGDPNGS